MKGYSCFKGYPQFWRATDESGEFRSVGNVSTGEGYRQGYRHFVEFRSLDPSHQVLQVSTDPCELKIFQSGEECVLR